MAKNKRLRGKVDKPASPAVVRQRLRERLYAEGKAIRESCPRAGQSTLIAGYLGKAISLIRQ
jgi:hypothetical protein